MSTFPEVFSLLAQLFHSGLFCPLAQSFSNFAHWAAPMAVTALWQGAIVAAGLALCLRLVPRVAAAHRFAAWAAGFGVLVALPFVPALAHMFTLSAGPATGFNAAAPLPQTPHPWLSFNDGWSMAIAALWVILALVRLTDLAIHSVRLRRLWKSAIPVAMESALGTVSPVGGVRFELCTTRELDRPSVIGFFAPRILIPEWLFEKLSPQELEQVVLHEAEHLRRHDDWTNLLQKLCLAVFPLNPALAFIERSLCGEREMACDEGVVRRTQAPRAYAACLAGLAERGLEHRAQALSLGARARALTLGAFDRRPELARRVHSILLRRSAMHPVASRALLGAVGCALAFGAVELARCPQLVAFVPTEPQGTTQTAQIVPEELRGDRVLAPVDPQLSASGFRSVNAMAIMPQTVKQRIASSGRTMAQKECRRTSSTGILRSAIHAAQAVNGDSTDVIAASEKTGIPVQQELVVYTAFEQVQESRGEPGDRVVSDTDSDVAAGTQPGQPNSGQFTVTRLVFRVYPVAGEGQGQTTATPTSTTGPGAARQSSNPTAGKQVNTTANKGSHPNDSQDSLTGQQWAVPFGNGWFVIQL